MYFLVIFASIALTRAQVTVGYGQTCNAEAACAEGFNCITNIQGNPVCASATPSYTRVSCATKTITSDCYGLALSTEEDQMCVWNPVSSTCVAASVEDNDFTLYETDIEVGEYPYARFSTGVTTGTGSTVSGAVYGDLAEEQAEANAERQEDQLEGEYGYVATNTGTSSSGTSVTQGTTTTFTGTATGSSTSSNTGLVFGFEDQLDIQEDQAEAQGFDERFEECFQRSQEQCIGECIWNNNRCIEYDIALHATTLRKAHTTYVQCHTQASKDTCNGYAYGGLSGAVCGWHPTANICVSAEIEYEGEYDGPEYGSNGFELDGCYGRSQDTCVGECYWTGTACGEYDIAPLKSTHETQNSWKTLAACSVLGASFGVLVSVFITRHCDKRSTLGSNLLDERV